MGLYAMATGKPGKSGFGSASTAEDVTRSIDATHLTAIVTGGTSGIGLEAARVLAARGAHVIIAARNIKAGNESKEMIHQMIPNARIDFLQLDLSSTKSVRSFAHQFLTLGVPLNILINNAGVMNCPYQLTEDGIESQFATNHIGHFLLTNLLLDKMKSSARECGIQGRIVILSSIAHFYTYPTGIKFDSINDPKGYSERRAYGQSKLANLLHANALSRKLKEEGVNITVNSLHPGLVTTNLFRHSGFGMKVFKAASFFLWKNIPQGASTTCYVALHPDLKDVTGKYFADCNMVTPMPRRICFTCNACGKQGDQSPYLCIQCNFMIHRSCIDLPRVIWINRHDHRISLTYDLDADIENLDLECKVCRQAVDPSYGAYSCLECKNMVFHSRCATKYHIWDGRDLEGEPEEVEDVAPFKVIGDNLIKHFSHEEHDLEFIENENVDRETIACRACIKPIGAERFYKCLQCDFFLHKACANLPRKIRSVLFDEKLILVGGASSFQDTFCCSPCGRYSSGFRFQNGPNSYRVDLQCIMTRDTLKREAHPHPLYFFTTEPTKCNSCNEEEHYGFRCVKVDCAFSLCYKCAVLFPETVKHKSDDHTLRLCYQEYGNGKYWCDICEKEVDNYYKQYYTCDDCGTTLHIKCVLGDVFGSISPGSMITHNWFEFQVVANSGINRKLCCVCHSRCTFSLALKIHDDLDRYICSSYDCLNSS